MRRMVAKYWLILAVVVVGGCASTGPIAPLVPLPDYMMPSKEALTYHPWRVVISSSEGRYGNLETMFCAELKQQLAKYGILTVGSDARTAELLHQMLQVQAASGEDIRVSDLQYEISSADGLISVTVDSMTVPKRNEVTTWYDKSKKKQRRTYTSQVEVSGHYTLLMPETGMTRTVQFENSQTQTSYDRPHQCSTEQMAQEATRQAACSSGVIRPLYTRFPLSGHIIGVGDTAREILINRGTNQGVRRDRKWELLMRTSTDNVLMGKIVTDQVVGVARTVRVYADSCVAKCDSRQTRERAKLGMRVRAQGFGFSFAGLFGLD